MIVNNIGPVMYSLHEEKKLFFSPNVPVCGELMRFVPYLFKHAEYILVVLQFKPGCKNRYPSEVKNLIDYMYNSCINFASVMTAKTLTSFEIYCRVKTLCSWSKDLPCNNAVPQRRM